MSEQIDGQLLGLKGFTFDGDTGKTLSDLYETVNAIGGTRDAPFIKPLRLEGQERPAVVNSYVDPEGRRFHVIWRSDNSGLSFVVDVILDAPSLAREENADSCGTCCGDISGILEELAREI